MTTNENPIRQFDNIDDIAAQIVDLMADHNLPFVAIDDVFAAVKSIASFQNIDHTRGWHKRQEKKISPNAVGNYVVNVDFNVENLEALDDIQVKLKELIDLESQVKSPVYPACEIKLSAEPKTE